jgi:hypothetical protein
MYAATRQQDDGCYIYTPVNGRYGEVGTEAALAQYVSSGLAYIFIVRGEVADAPGIEDYGLDAPLALVDGWYDPADSDESPGEFAKRIFAEAREAAE